MKIFMVVLAGVAVSKCIDVFKFLFVGRRKKKKKKNPLTKKDTGIIQQLFPGHSNEDILHATDAALKLFPLSRGPCEINPHPIEDPKIIKLIQEALKPITLPEQKVFDDVKDMMEKI